MKKTIFVYEEIAASAYQVVQFDNNIIITIQNQAILQTKMSPVSQIS